MQDFLFLLINNWEIIGLILTNIGALFLDKPRLNNRTRKDDYNG